MENSNQISVADANVSSVRHDKFTRRGFLGIGSAALAAAGIGTALAADRSRSDPGPGNPALDALNPDSMWPPSTDSKSLVPTFTAIDAEGKSFVADVKENDLSYAFARAAMAC